MKKVAFIDVDGTLTQGLSSWEKVHHHFGLKEEMKQHAAKYFAGEINYEQWANLDVGLWKGKRLEELHKALNPPELIKGAVEGVARLKEAGYEIILLSGGINIMVDEVASLVKADAAHSNELGISNGVMDGTVGVTVGLKSKVIKELQQETIIDLDGSIALGDNFNDIDMFELVGRSVAVNPKSDELLQVASDVVHTDDFNDVVSVILED